ncbi:DGQHR domain-containing protein, partial [bacterium]|nr:DGQHR domain-containing protein [bacterium]
MESISVPAIRFIQSGKHILYSFIIDGILISKVASVSRISRNDKEIEGYQRPEVLAHIDDIKDYLKSDSPLLPNAIVIALDNRVVFYPDGTNNLNGSPRKGTLQIPIDERKPCGWIVDGQQRVAAFKKAGVENFPTSVIAFVSEETQTQLEQFILVNHTKALPSGLIFELLPQTEVKLPTRLLRKLRPTRILEILNHDKETPSPLYRMILTPTVPEGRIKDNSILRMLEYSLSDGALYRFASLGGLEMEKIKDILYPFWEAVHEVFPDEWELPPRKCRLLHGAGITALGFLMDMIYDRYVRIETVVTREHYQQDLEKIAPYCRWRAGIWEFGPGQQRRWDEIQNTPKDIRI